MKPEVFFLKYAFPCSFIIRQRGEITEKEFKMLEDAAINGKSLPRKLLEKVYFRAFEKIGKLADEMGKDKWDLSILKEYFLTRHNNLINDGMYSYAEAPEALKNLCKVHKAKVVGIKKDALIVEYDGGKRRPVLKTLVPDANLGDTVTIHYGYAVEKV